MLEQQPVRTFALHDLQSIQHLAMRCPFPDRKDHRLAQPALHAIFLQCSHAAVHFHRPFGRLQSELCCPVLRQVSYQPKKMIALRVRRLLLPYQVEQTHSFPSQPGSRAEPPQTILELPPKQRMFDDRFPEGGAPFRERIGIGDGPLCECYAAHALGHAREVQHFDNQIDSLLRLPQQPTLALTKFDLTGWYRASGDLVLEAAYPIIQLPVFSATRYQVQT